MGRLNLWFSDSWATAWLSWIKSGQGQEGEDKTKNFLSKAFMYSSALVAISSLSLTTSRFDRQCFHYLKYLEQHLHNLCGGCFDQVEPDGHFYSGPSSASALFAWKQVTGHRVPDSAIINFSADSLKIFNKPASLKGLEFPCNCGKCNFPQEGLNSSKLTFSELA